MATTKRCNNSIEAEFYDDSLSSPFAEGGFRYVAEGEYTEGHRKGQKAVCKWFKTGHVHEETFFEQDIRAMEKGVELVQLWNQQNFIHNRIRVNVPEVWTFPRSDFFFTDTQVLVEPFIRNYQKFNSNSGWVLKPSPLLDSSSQWSLVMQALSHFTYHITNGQYLLCDLQGGIYPETNAAVLTDTAIHSAKKEFGVTDYGQQGISTFFCQHKCNRFCQPYWRKPQDQTQYYRSQEGTSMMSSVGMSSVVGKAQEDSALAAAHLHRLPQSPLFSSGLFARHKANDNSQTSSGLFPRFKTTVNMHTNNANHHDASSNSLSSPPPSKRPRNTSSNGIGPIATGQWEGKVVTVADLMVPPPPRPNLMLPPPIPSRQNSMMPPPSRPNSMMPPPSAPSMMNPDRIMSFPGRLE